MGFALWHPVWRPYLPVTISNERGNYPLGAVDYLAANQFQGKLVTDFDAGAYVTWKLYPRVLVSLDGRYEAAFKPGVMEEHIELFDAKENWGKWLDQWQAEGMVVPSGSKLGQHLETIIPKDIPVDNATVAENPPTHEFPGSERRWKCVYRDPGTMVWMEEKSPFHVFCSRNYQPIEPTVNKRLTENASPYQRSWLGSLSAAFGGGVLSEFSLDNEERRASAFSTMAFTLGLSL